MTVNELIEALTEVDKPDARVVVTELDKDDNALLVTPEWVAFCDDGDVLIGMASS